MPRVSVVIPAYNSAAYLKEAIESVLTQIYPIAEIVVVDDGSTDDTASIIAPYTGAGVRYIYQPKQGPSAARNRGIAETHEELIAFLDSDDIWLPDKIARQVAYLTSNPDIMLVSGDLWWWKVEDNSRRIVHRGIKPKANPMRQIAVHNFVGNASLVVVRRSILCQTGVFDPSIKWGEDWELWTRIVSIAKIGFIPEPLIIYRWHPGGNAHYKRWERIQALFAISLRAIKRIQPPWWRPIILARAWSYVELRRAAHAIEHGFPKRQQLFHASLALGAYPFENINQKLNLVFRAVFGHENYRRVRDRILRRTSSELEESG